MGEIKVLQPGLYSTIQDEGRFGFLNSGVPISGPMDTYAAQLGNLILNNSQEDPVLEITQTGPVLKFGDAANIVVTGGYLSPQINGTKIMNNRIYNLVKDDTLSFGQRVKGSRAYMSIKGGFKTNKILGSCCWYEGLTPHFRLSKGMQLYFEPLVQMEIEITSGVKFGDNYLTELNVPVYRGPEFHLLPIKLQQELITRTFSQDSANNRMAIQLSENFENTLRPIITGPVIAGTVQLTPSGKIIILMRDCQTTGGYPRVLQVSEEGLNILSQKITGDKIKFVLSALPVFKKEVPPV